MTHRLPALLFSIVLMAAAPLAAHAAPGGVVKAVNGKPTVVRGEKSEQLAAGAKLELGDEVRTGADTKVEIDLPDGSVLTIGPDTKVRIDDLVLTPDSRKGKLSVLLGRFRLAVAKFSGSTNLEVETPTAVAGVRGTVIWGDTKLDAICALEGHVEVRSRKGPAVAEFDTGNCVEGMGKGETKLLVPTKEQLAAFLAQVTLE